jgi:AraC-like DNA-binding protein
LEFPSANRQLAAVFDKMLTEELARLDKSDVVSRCRAAVLRHLSSGGGTAEDTAKQLHMSPRTLQRKLAEANTTTCSSSMTRAKVSPCATSRTRADR